MVTKGPLERAVEAGLDSMANHRTEDTIQTIYVGGPALLDPLNLALRKLKYTVD